MLTLLAFGQRRTPFIKLNFLKLYRGRFDFFGVRSRALIFEVKKMGLIPTESFSGIKTFSGIHPYDKRLNPTETFSGIQPLR